MKHRLLLVSPNDFATTYGDLRHISHLIGDTGRLLNVSLPTIAALTPDEFEIRIVDENAEELDFEERWDIVGITGFPPQVFRARELADEFRRRGALIVCGGTSVSLSPERWRDFADVLIIGEAERVWPKFIADYLAKRVQPEYRELERLELGSAPLPDYSPMSPAAVRRFSGGIVQTSRGCPFDCEFCDAIIFAGRKMRYKPVDRILTEIEQLDRMGMRHIYLADDNFGAGRKQAKEILRALAAWNAKRDRPIPFLTQLTIDLSKDAEFLTLAAQAGLTKVFVGLETPNRESLIETHKLQNVRTDMHEGVRSFQERGIEVLGGCVVGFDHDDLSIFRRQLRFFTEIGVISVQVYPLNAPDATPLKERMIREGRYIDWSKSEAVQSKHFSYFNSYTIVPKQMTVAQLQQGTYWLLWNLYDWDNATERLKAFFDVFESSPHRQDTRMPGGIGRLGLRTGMRVLRHNRTGLGILGRVVGNAIRRGTGEERRALRQMLQLAAYSSHPQRWQIALNSYLTVLNTRLMLLAQAPGIAQTAYPTGAPPPAAPSPSASLSSLRVLT